MPSKPSTSLGSRRQFLKTSAAFGAGVTFLPSTIIRGADAPSNKLNIALIGTWGRGAAHFGVLKKENVVALCDIDENHLEFGAKTFPNAQKYVDWRKALDQKGLDAVVCCTTDHTHAFISNWALNRNLHVYCEKPLGNCVHEVRTVRENWLKKKGKLATQVGTQRHAIPNFNRVREMVVDGAIGELTDVYAWGNRKIPRPGYLPAQGDPPKHLHYDLWIGPSPMHPYNPGYFAGGPGANCLSWNMFWDFGTGQIGDMGSHVMDLAWNAIDVKLPISASATGEPFNKDVVPVRMTSSFEFPANDWHGPIKLSWYMGGDMPRSPQGYVDLNKVGHGVMFKGKEGFLVADFASRVLLPYGRNADMAYYKPRSKDKVLPDLGGFQEQWIEACKDPSKKTACDFEYSGNAIETMLLGLIAYRVGKKFKYDGAAGKVIDCPEAQALITRKYRDGWTLDG